MRVYVTGAIGFVGGWLERELVGHGHEVVGAPGPDQLDITDRRRLSEWLLSRGEPDAVVHLAGMAFAPDARSDPAEAFRVNLAGTAALFEALRALDLRPAILVTGSSEVYGAPVSADLPLTEASTVAPATPYAVSKLGQEAVAVEAAVRHGFHVVVTRSFNHTGPGQRRVFVVPAMAARVLAMQRGETSTVRVGNIDVARDITDVRDVVHAYRLLAEGLVSGQIHEPLVINVASGVSITIRTVIERLCDLVGMEPRIEVDETLVRAEDPPDIRGSAALLTQLTGWQPHIAIDQTLADVLADIRRSSLPTS